MEKKNILGLNDDDLDRRIYRIIPVKYLYLIFSNKQNTLSRTYKWNDPFENFMLKCKFKLPTGEIATIGFRDHFYGQCWSTRSQSEALWRLYSETKQSVRIRSTPRKLFTGLCKHLGSWAHVSAFIGEVKYFGKKRLIAHADRIFANIGLPGSIDFAKTLLFKRTAFRHEEEIRLLYLPKGDPKGDLFSYPINPLDIVDDIRLDPRLDLKQEQTLKREIQHQTGFKGTIRKSGLYDPPPNIVLDLGLAMTSRAPGHVGIKRK